LEKIYSPINGEILVVEDLFGRREVMIGRVAQSGGLAEKLWREGIGEILRDKDIKDMKKLRVLILGLGVGTLAKLVTKRHPLDAEIVGIEIDPLVVELGKKYFGLGEIPNLKIVVGDAISLVQSSKFNTSTSSVLSRAKSRDKVQSFDLVIVDLYLGQEFPKEAESEDFLRRLGKLANKGGLVVFNRLYFNRHHQEAANQFKKNLTPIFSQVKTKKLVTNLLILASL